MYGRDAHLPIDLTRVQEEGEEMDLETKVEKMLELREKLPDQARENILKEQQHQKKQYDAKHNAKTKLKVGDKVLMKSMKNEGKKDASWSHNSKEVHISVQKIWERVGTASRVQMTRCYSRLSTVTG